MLGWPTFTAGTQGVLNGKISIICPVYNEAEVIRSTLSEIALKVTIPHDLLIVYDFDEDNTLPVVRAYIEEARADHIQLVRNDIGKGVVNALRKGFQEATNGAILVVMGDLSDDLGIVQKMYRMISEEGYDLVCGSRYMRGGKHIGGPILKKSLSRAAGVSIHLLTGMPTHDVSNSFKMYRKSLIEDITIESTGGFEIGFEILAKAFIKGKKIGEIPSVWMDRAGGESKFQLSRWLPHYLHWYFLLLKHKFVSKVQL